MIQTINPYTQKPICTYSFLSETEVRQQIEASQKAFLHWKTQSYTERQNCILKLGEILEQQASQCAQLIVTEMGKPITEATAEVLKCAKLCLYYGQLDVAEIGTKHYPLDNYQEARTICQPLGIILGIMPWNFPFWQVLRYAIPALLMGNTTLLKHAPNTVGCGNLLQTLFEEAGFPQAVFCHSILDIPQVATLLAHPYVQGVALTGSERAGSEVAALAGRYLKKSVLELGGSDPFLVLADADLDTASTKAVQSRFLNAGQVCIAAKRFILHQDIAADFLKLFQTKVEKLTVGNPLDPHTQLSVMAREDLAIKASEQLEKGLQNGASLLLGGQRKGLFFEPTILQLQTDNPLLKEEVFAPIALVLIAKDEDEMLQIANDTPYGLGASVWSSSREKAQQFALQIEAGCVAINEMVVSDPYLPFGGIKKSGYGRELSENALFEFVNLKTIYQKN